VQTIRDVAELRKAVEQLRKKGGRVALVPTMGALHSGHMALVAEAKRQSEHVVVSIFVNPAQFGPKEDLGSYPRQEVEDSKLLQAAGCTLLWAPDAATMYPQGYSTSIQVAGASEGLDGAARPGHFDGVATVVTKLLNQVRPDLAVFGEKDFQQLAVIRRLVCDLDLAVDIVPVPTQREADGLALSSRNSYLSAEERLAARTLPRALGEAAAAIRQGGDVAKALQAAAAKLIQAGFGQVDYVALCDSETLQPVDTLARPARILAAARIGRTRLIDNLPVLHGGS
jgi:pantoate--beta-alanine ligase